MIFFCLMLAVHAAAAPQVNAHKPSALDKKTLEAYVRHLFVWPEAIEIRIADPRPSVIPGFLEVSVLAKQGKAVQEERFLVSKDGQTLFQVQGGIYKVGENPYQAQLAKLAKPATPLRPSLGTTGAPVVLVEFSDFQCHFCKEEAKVLRENLLKDYPGQVRFYFVDYPLEGLHPWARAAAVAGRCTFRQNEAAFWEYHDWIFENQEQITSENLGEKVMDWAKGQTLDATELARCITAKATEGDVAAGLAEGRSLDVNSTPTLFVNGRPMPGAVPWPDLKRVIDFEIGYQKTANNAGEGCGCDAGIPKTGVK